jgi:ABC-2 type transport system ATP-binding protein
LTPAPLALRIAHLDKRFDARQALLRDINIDIAQGEFVALVGANGVGKTTLFKCLLDFCAIDAGTIEIHGIAHTESIARQPLCYLPERFACPPFATALDVLHYLTRLHRQRPSLAAIQDLLTMLDFPGDGLSKRVSTLSKGSAQKLGLAATLLSNKQLLLLDEPMSGLDPHARILLKRDLLRRKAQGLTLLFSTHLLADLTDFCDRLIILHRGTIRFCGTPAECLNKYRCATLEAAYLSCIEAAA